MLRGERERGKRTNGNWEAKLIFIFQEGKETEKYNVKEQSSSN